MAKQILIGTHNPSKIRSLTNRLSGFRDVTCLSPAQLGLEIDAAESGSTMVENALLKALAYHHASGLPVLSADSGLYFREFSMTDPRQPGPLIRRVGGKTLTDEEMLAYYGGLAREFGPLHACYCTAFAVVNAAGHGETFFQDDPNDPVFFDTFGFLLCDTPHPRRNPGWPLDSLSMDPYFRRYWFDIRDQEYDTPALAHRRSNELRFSENVNGFLGKFFDLTAKCVSGIIQV